MNTKTLALASVLAAGLASAAHAQTLTVTGSVVGAAPSYTYTYMVTPSFSTNQLIFNFSDANITFSSATGPLTLQSAGTVPTAGVFNFDSGQLAANNTETFTFFSPDAPGGRLGTVGIQYATATVASLNNITPAPAAAPEPGGMTALVVLFGCLGVGIAAKRRSAASAAA